MKITDHFSLEEFACRDGTAYPEEHIEGRLTPLCEALEILRRELGHKTIIINSGYRTPVYNHNVGGVKKSQHIQGLAADIRVKGVNPRRVAQVARKLIAGGYLPPCGIGDYSSFTHIDIRGYNARWKGR